MIRDAIDTAGPSGWLEWLLNMRNMYVHRARAMNTRTTQQAGGPIYLSPTTAYLPATLVGLLPRFPTHSDVQIVRGTNSLWDAYIRENCEETLTGMLESMDYLVSTVCRTLLEFWHRRKDNPVIIEQPFDKQWPSDEDPSQDAFAGYATQPLSIQADYYVMHPQTAWRYQAAAIMAETKHLWKSFE